MSFTCPNGHRVDRIRTINCPEPGCRASVVYEPNAVGLGLAAMLREVRLYAQKMARDREALVRTMGADLLQILDEDS